MIQNTSRRRKTPGSHDFTASGIDCRRNKYLILGKNMRWILRGAAVLAGLVLLALVIVYAGSEWVIRKGHAVPLVDVAIPVDAASIAEGARMARIANCRDCQGIGSSRV